MRSLINALPLVAAFIIPAVALWVATRRERAYQAKRHTEPRP